MKEIMKRIGALVLVLAMVLGMVACGAAKPEETEQTQQATEAEAAEVGGEGEGAKEGDTGAPSPEAEASREESKEKDTGAASPEAEASREESKEKDTGAASPEAEAERPNAESSPKEPESAETIAPNGDYNKGVVLVKVKDSFNKADLGTLAYTSAEPLYKGSKWYTVQLADAEKTQEAVTYLTGLGKFESVDYDYIMGTSGPKEDAEANPNYKDQVNLGLSNIPHGWTVNGKAPGGSPDVVVAIIDTGVDYNHPDLRNNIWKNTAEIANNGRDDDGNGYIDDVYGWDCVGNDKDPMDDNGHGTHVAGIIAAENNKEGGIGVAYNCKVMVLKAGNSSGYFNNSDIAEAIQYAYMNGASVINMSFGGSQISVAVEDALQSAYNSCILVAAAGNDGACNNLGCFTCDVKKVCYPAALPYVIGVMSTDKDGKHASSFSNYDHYPYDSVEYEVFAVGEGVGSTWPSNKYACLNGTSMAAPTVAGIAALLRSYYTDREMYSSKFIQSQIVNTGTVHPHIFDHQEDIAHSVADVQEAMTKLPKPAVNLYDYHIDDSTSINASNNGNGVIDAGETVRLYVELHNRGGVASEVNVSIDTDRGMGMTDPYFTFINPTMELSDIGTYSVRESGNKYFEIVVSADCPNDYLVDFNIRYTYKNGMDENDKTVYEDDGKQKAQFCVSRGFCLPAIINEDTIYTADRLYIVGEDVIIPEGVTVTFEEGCQIQFYDNREYYNSPIINVYGNLILAGTKSRVINILPSERHATFACGIQSTENGSVLGNYINAENLFMAPVDKNASITIDNSMLMQNNYNKIYIYNLGKIETYSLLANLFTLRYIDEPYLGNYVIQNSYIDNRSNGDACSNADSIIGCYYVGFAMNDDSFGTLAYSVASLRDNIIYSTAKGSHTPLAFVSTIENNMFSYEGDSLNGLLNFERIENRESFKTNTFAPLYQEYAGQIIDGYYDALGYPTVDVYGSCSDISKLWPYVVSMEMFDAEGNPITTIGKEVITVRVTFNRPMDTTKDTYLTFGTIEPYADYKIEGSYISDTVWEGTYTLKAQIENGQNFLKVMNACAAEDQTKTVFGEYQLHEFTIDTTEAMAMNLQAVAKDEGIELTFAQDDYDTLLGYNIYRSTDKDGNFVKLNPTILLPEENTFLDDNAEPGKTYWYTYTVVLSDFTESAPAGKVQATAKDTQAPSLYHTPVNQGYENNNLVISCTASDNVAIETVTLYYRSVGATEWKSLTMSKLNDKYSATIFGSDVTLSGIEYYIVAADALNTVNKGSADAPYTIIVKSADSLLGKGDVDGNGTVTTKDALMLMQCLNGDLLLADDAFKRADLNGDGLLSSAEALRILQYVNGKVTTLSM